MKRLSILSFILSASFLFNAAESSAQSLTGIWRGVFYNPTEIAMGGSKYRYEVQVNTNGRDAKGVTYSYQTTRFYGKASMIGVWSPSTKNLVLQEDNILELKITGGGDGCLMTCYLTYRKENDKEYLEGSYTSANMNNKNQNCGGGRVFLEKVPDTDFELEDFLKNPKEAPKTTTTTTPKVKPGQEEFLVNKPPTKTTKPPVNKPPVTTTKPPANSGKPATTTKPPVATTKPPSTTKPPATTAKPPVANTKPTTPKPPAQTGSSTVTTKKPPATKPVAKDSIAKVPAEDVAKLSTEPVKPKPAPLPPPPQVLKERKNELFKTITTTERTIEISFFDNGEIDGDTISVYSNNRLIASKKGLSAKPITLKITLDDGQPEQDLVMVAENLGTIPPNTALMIVKAGTQRYTLYLSSTEQKNAMVRFRYEAP